MREYAWFVTRGGFGKLNVTLMAPFAAAKRVSCSTLVHLIRCRVRGNISFLYVVNAATRAPYLSTRRGGGLGGLFMRHITKEIPVLVKYNNGGATTVIHRLGRNS